MVSIFRKFEPGTIEQQNYDNTIFYPQRRNP